MADNRMVLKNLRTGTAIDLAKYYQATGWHVIPTADQICDAFSIAAFGHLPQEERKKVNKRSRTGPPFANGTKYGDEWVLEYMYVTEETDVSLGTK